MNNTLTLQTAILNQIDEFIQDRVKFSIHQITCELRQKCNSGELQIPETRSFVDDDKFEYFIKHTDVKRIFVSLWETGALTHLSRETNGMYFEYQLDPRFVPQSSNTPVQDSSVSNSSDNTCDDDIKHRIIVYLNNSVVSPTLKQIQSGIKRKNSTGLTCAQLEIIIPTLGYTIDPSSSSNTSQKQVSL